MIRRIQGRLATVISILGTLVLLLGDLTLYECDLWCGRVRAGRSRQSYRGLLVSLVQCMGYCCVRWAFDERQT